jgi:hypothetical protein
VSCSGFISLLAEFKLIPAWASDTPFAIVPIGEDAAATAAAAAATIGDYKSLSVLACNQRILAATEPVVRTPILVAAAQQYAATGVVSVNALSCFSQHLLQAALRTWLAVVCSCAEALMSTLEIMTAGAARILLLR